MKSLICIFLVCHLFSALSWAGSGNEVGNGADDSEIGSGSAWFVDLTRGAPSLRVIRYCLKLDSQFAVPDSQVELEIAKAFQTWDEYLIQKEVNRTQRYFIVTASEKMESCDGTEDLRLELGTTSDEIEKEKQKYINPTGFAVLQKYEQNALWGQGFIWLAAAGSVHPEKSFPNWKEPGILRALLLHELGHVFGNSHIEGTIMDERISSSLQSGLLAQQSLFQIDYSRELHSAFFALRCYEGMLGLPDHPESQRNVFQILFHRQPVGEIRSRLVIDKAETLLIVADQQGEARFHLLDTDFEAEPAENAPLAFKKAFFEGNQLIEEGFSTGGRIRTGTLLTLQNETVKILFEENIGNSHSSGDGIPLTGPMNLKFSWSDRKGVLFTSHPLGPSSSRCN